MEIALRILVVAVPMYLALVLIPRILRKRRTLGPTPWIKILRSMREKQDD